MNSENNSVKNFIIESVKALDDKVTNKEFDFLSVAEHNAYKTCQIYAISYEKGLGLKNLKDEVKSNAMVELLKELNQRADGGLVEAEKSEAFKAHSREIVAIAKEIDSLLKKLGVEANSFRIAGYKYDFLTGVNQLVVAYQAPEKLEINVNFDVDKLESKNYVTPELVKEWANVDIAYLSKLEEIGRIEEINRVIENLLNGINNEIAKITIKNKLDIIGESLKNNKIDNENIYEIFAQAILSLDNVNLMDCLSSSIYSQKFYNQHLLGSREADNKEAYEIIKTLHEKTPGEDLAMCFFDINIFKNINDEMGHDIGDKVIIELSNQLKDSIGDSGIISRRGGDEFIIIAPVSAITKAMSFQLSMETVVNNSVMLQGFIDALPDNDERKNRDFPPISLSMTAGVKKIDFAGLNPQNCARELAKCDSAADFAQSKHKDIAHYVFGCGSRGSVVSDESFERSRFALMRNLYDELGVKKIEVFGETINVDMANEYENGNIEEKINSLKMEQLSVYSKVEDGASLEEILGTQNRNNLTKG